MRLKSLTYQAAQIRLPLVMLEWGVLGAAMNPYKESITFLRKLQIRHCLGSRCNAIPLVSLPEARKLSYELQSMLRIVSPNEAGHRIYRDCIMSPFTVFIYGLLGLGGGMSAT